MVQRTKSPKPGAMQTVTQERPAHIDNGDDARGAANARGNQTTTQPDNSPAMAAAGSSDQALEAASNVAHLAPGKGRRPNLFSEAASRVSQQAREKITIMGDARQKLAEANDLFSKGDEFRAEATETAAKAAVLLYKGRTDGALTADEVSGTLGDIFGYKPKADGTPGKTPDGQGEAIRKRVVRAAQAWEYANDGDGGKFFEGMDRAKVAQLCNNLEGGSLSIYSLYDYLGELKRETMTRTNPAFDPKRVAQMVEALTEEGAVSIIVANPALQLAYGELLNVLNEVGEAAAKMAKPKATAA